MEDYESPVRSKGPLESQSTFSGKNPSSNPWRPQVRRRALPTGATERVPWNPLPPSTHRPVMIAHIALWPTALRGIRRRQRSVDGPGPGQF